MAMSDYERSAYQSLTAPPPDSRSLMPGWARDTASRVGRSVRTGAAKVPGSTVVADAYAKAAKGLTDFTTGNGIHSVSMERSIARYQKKGADVEKPEDILRLDLRRCDEMLPGRKRLHEVAALAEGAAASLLITGATVSSTVTGGTTAAVALTTVAADSVIVMAGLGRVVGEVAVAYGFDPNLPEEEVFALQVLGLGMAVGSGAKSTALASLSRLTQDMMRRATWTQLNEHVLVGVVNRAFATMGLRLTQKKLAQVVPVAGVLISSGVNLQLLHRVQDAAVQAYRLRFLTVKYGLAAVPSTALVLAGSDDAGDEEDVVEIDALLREAVEEAGTHPGESTAGDAADRQDD
ncbi:EcsC family protein [Cellulomonas septica]|nr:EcsC family protein [Cellulomonas septica]